MYDRVSSVCADMSLVMQCTTKDSNILEPVVSPALLILLATFMGSE